MIDRVDVCYNLPRSMAAKTSKALETPGLTMVSDIGCDRRRKYPPAEAVGEKLLGAIAGGAVSHDVRNKAHEAGFFVLEPKGKAVYPIPPSRRLRSRGVVV